jgi:Uma2 family endonuclease
VRLPGGEPEPDLAIVMGPAGRYDTQHPTPAEIAMLVEVADSTLQYDRTLKLRAYALAGVPVYWIVNLEDRQIEVFTNPVASPTPTYSTTALYSPGQQLPLVVAGQHVAQIVVADLLP